MYLHEYQGKKFLESLEIPCGEFFVVDSSKSLKEKIKEKKWDEAVLKIQVHAGGRGKAGGIRFVNDSMDINTIADEMLNVRIINEQTGKKGLQGTAILITKPLKIKKEYYIAIVLDRKKSALSFILSSEGGMEIEETAKKFPEKIFTFPIPDNGILKTYHHLLIQKTMGWTKDVLNQGLILLDKLIKAFKQTDATLLEINPLALTEDNILAVLDVKLSIDDNAFFRQKAFFEDFDFSQLPIQERKAISHDLSYVALEGNIGCMVNGAGLAMATMDIIHFYGGHPANFLDIGGSATKEKIKEGLKILLEDSQVKVILINIFGGIMNCQTVAEGIVSALKEKKTEKPFVIRLEGTNVEEGKKILEEAKLSIQTANDLDQAARFSVSFAKKGE